ncbi:MAG: PEP-CTERM sorting domain-containing protein [Fimbriimonadaceae bacterium]|nr:MAG: PEP-CTERM sorting domain-containing protein [Fimbriimonadaceae bacterium]
MKKGLVAFAVGVVAVVPVMSQAIVWRDGRTDAEMQAFGATSRFLGVGKVNVGGGFGTGTFLGIGTGGQAWGISAKHVITTGNTGTFTFGDGGSYSITQAIGFAGVDVSIFKISGWNRNVFTPGLNTSGVYTLGTEFDSAGYGGHGQVGTMGGNWLYDNNRRGMQTVLNSTQTRVFNGESQFMLIDEFTSPANGARFYEGFGAPGDSGSMLLDNSGKIWGVLSGGEFEQYGAKNWYATITPTIANQIYQTTGINPVPEPASMMVLGAGIAALVARKRKNS